MWIHLLALFGSVGAEAQISRVGFADGLTCTDTMACTDASMCTPFESSDVCDPMGYCIGPTRREALCCEGGDVCPTLGIPGGDRGTCIDVFGADGEVGGSVCEYPFVTFCPDGATLTVDEVMRCMTDPRSLTIVTIWVKGDCDGDHCPNGEDPDPCDRAVACPMTPDAGPIAGTDAGGDGDTDSGPMPTVDSGPTGGPGPETPPVTGDTEGVRFHGEGGCACRTSGAGPLPPLALGAIGGVALALLSRRRRPR